MKCTFTILFTCIAFFAKSQKVDSIYFNLYTDSLKKGVYNYINVDGKLSNGSYLPLMSKEIDFTSTGGKWDGNSLILDTGFKENFVVVTAKLKANPAVVKTVTVYIKKVDIQPALKTEKELLEEWKTKGKSRKG